MSESEEDKAMMENPNLRCLIYAVCSLAFGAGFMLRF